MTVLPSPPLPTIFERFFTESADRLDPRRRPDQPDYTTDPVGWVTEQLGEFLWSKQQDILNALTVHRRVAVPSAHATGKSFTAARAVCWWLAVHQPGEAFVVTTAPTAPQVRAILWREIGRAHRKGRLPGRTNQTEWFLGNELVAFGRKPSDYDPDAFQGIHARYVLVVIDEGCGVPESLYHAAASLAANEHSRILAIGNPDDPGSYFATICAVGSGWHVIPVDGLDSPNFTDEAIPDSLRALLLSPVYVDELRRDVGEDSPIFQSKARGRFPQDTADGVIPLSWIRRCQGDRELSPADLLPVELGFDVAAGGDQAVLRERRGIQTGRVWRSTTADSSILIGQALEAINQTGASRIKVDVIGVGWAVAGRLRELRREGKHSAEVVPVNVGEASTAPARFPKLRDQVWWECGRELIGSGALDLRGLDDTTIAQLVAPLWQPDSAGRVHVERKSDTRKRLHRSPDDADAWLLAYFTPPRQGWGAA